LKRKFLAIATVVIVIVFMAIPLAMAHAPLGTGDNESIGKATVILDPTKSWALYSQLNSDGDAQYYTFNITAGQKIHVTLYKSMRPEDANFIPRLVIIGPDVAAQGSIPKNISVPSGSNARLVAQTQLTPTYEPFSPSIFTGLADETIVAPTPGKYYLVVFEQSNSTTGGNYGIAIGNRETYTIDEWLLIPLNLMNIYQWEGQSRALILTPMIATLVVGIVLVAWRFRKQCDLSNPMAWIGAIAGLTFIGTTASTLFQLLVDAAKVTVGAEASITAIFIVIPLILGLVTLRVAIKNSQKATVRKRIYFMVLGVAAIFMWAGLIVGPILAIIAAVMPTNLKRKK
jgi:hypothetical protein